MAGYNLGTASGRIVVDGSGAKAGFQVAEAAAQSFYSAMQNRLSEVENFGENLMKASAVGAAGFAVAGHAAANFEERLSAVKAVSGATEEQMDAISEAALQIGANTAFSATEAASAFEELVKAGISVDDALNGAAQATADLAAAGEVALPRAAEIAATAMNNFNMSGEDMPRVADMIAGAANASAISVEEYAQSLQQVGAVANLTGLSFEDTSVAIAEMGNAGIKGSDAGTSLKTMLMNLIPVTDRQVEEFERLGLMAFDSGRAMNALAKNGIPSVGDSFEQTRQAVSDYLEETEGIPNDTKEMGKAVDEWLMKNGAMNNAFFDTEGNLKSLAEVQQILQDSTKDMTKEQQLASLELLFGADAIRGAAVMAGNGAKGFDELAASMGKVTAQDVSATRLDNLKGDLEELSGAWETMMIKIGQVVTPIARSVVQAFTAVINVFNNLDERAQRFFASVGLGGTVLAGVVGAVIKLAFVLAPLLLLFAKFMLVRNVYTIFSSFWKVLSSGGGILAASAAGFARLRAVIAGMVSMGGRLLGFAKIMRIVWAALMGPIGLVVAAIAALVAIGVTLYNTWEPFRNLVDNIAASLGGAFAAAVQGAKDLWQNFVDGFSGSGEAVGGVAGVMQGLGEGIRVLWDTLKEVGAGIWAQIVPAWESFMEIMRSQVAPAMQQLGDVVMNQLWPALQNLGGVLRDEVFPALQQMWAAIAPVIGFLVKLALTITGGLIMGLIYLAGFIFGTLVPAFLRLAGPVLGFLLTAIAKVAGWIVQYLITPLVDFVSFLLGTVVPGIADFVSGFIDGFVDAWNAVTGWVSDVIGAIGGFFSWLGGAGDGAGESASSSVGGFFSAIGQFFADVWNSITDFVSGVAAAVANFLQPAVDAVTAAWTAIYPVVEYFGSIFARVFNAIAGLVQAVFGLIFQILRFAFALWLAITVQALTGIWNFIQTVWNTIVTVVQTALTAIWTVISTIWNAIVAFLTPILTAIWTTITTVWNQIVATVTSVLSTIWSVISAVWNRVFGFVSGVLNRIWSVVSAVWNRVTSVISSALNTAWSIVSSIWNTIYNFISGIVNRVWSTVSNAFNRVRDAMRSAVNGAYNSVKERFDAVMGVVTGIKDRIVGFFSGAGSWLASAGRSIMDGLVQGIEDGIAWVRDKLNAVTDMIPDWKGPAERDAILLKPAGKLIMNSLVDGLESETDKVYRLLNGMNTDIPMSLDTILNPPKFTEFDAAMMAGAAPISAGQVIPEVAGTTLAPKFDVTVRIGDRDITDIVDIRIDEHLGDTADMIGTGVNN